MAFLMGVGVVAISTPPSGFADNRIQKKKDYAGGRARRFDPDQARAGLTR
jgi:hypothetical protein